MGYKGGRMLYGVFNFGGRLYIVQHDLACHFKIVKLIYPFPVTFHVLFVHDQDVQDKEK